MKRDPLLYGVIGVLIGGVIVWFMATSAVNNNNTGMMQMMGMRGQAQQRSMMQGSNGYEMGMGSSMNEMMDNMSDKTGNDFDQAFLSSMIVHHQGAIEMAKKAQKSAMHEGVKKLADDIITAQTNEIEMMQKWQEEWR